MSREEPMQTEATVLARMLSAAGSGVPTWRPDELGAILEHQFDSPLELELGTDIVRRAGSSPSSTEAAEHALKTFRELFQHPCPPVELLNATRQFAKQCRNRPDSPLPDEISTLLYFLAIAVARTRRGVKISGLDGKDLRKGLDWAQNQSWLSPDIHGIIRESIASLDARL